MKKNISKVLVLLLCLVVVVATAGCNNTSNSDVTENRYDATVVPRTGNNATIPLVISTYTLDGKFNPFFATSAYDVEIQGNTQLMLLHYDKDGAPQAGIEYPSYAYSYTQDVSSDNSLSTYKFILKNGITFSDGTPVTAKDVLFSTYVYSDPLYDGSTTLYTMDIQGINEYRLQTSADVLVAAEAIVNAGITTDDDGAIVYANGDGFTAAQQEAFWAYLDQAGEKFAQEIVDYCQDNYLTDDMVQTYFAEELTAAELSEDNNLKIAFGMGMWGFGGYDYETKTFTDAIGNTYVLGTDDFSIADYWNNILTSYGYDLSDGGINYEMAGANRIEDYVRDLYIANEGGVEGGVDSIAGITSGAEVCEDGVEREYIQVVMNGIDPTAIFKLGMYVSPWEYYTDGYEGELNEYGVVLNDPDFIQCLKDKNDKPMGAGPYVFDEFKDNIVYYTANDLFLLGSPKIKYLRYQVIDSGAELDAVRTGTVYFSNPSASTTIINDITSAQGDYAKLAYVLVDNDGYGYIGINGQIIPDWNIRKALSSAMNTQLCIDNYYGELATLNYRTMTKIQWAYPENPDNLFPYDSTGETVKTAYVDAGYVYDADNNIMYYSADSEMSDQQVTLKATMPMEAKDHPAGSIFLDMQEVLAKVGIKLDIEVDDNLLNKLATAYESGVQIWAAAWGSGGVDPDMFQIWCSDPVMNQSTSPTAKGLYWLYNNGSEDQKAALVELNDLIDAGRATLDVEERKVIYAQALEISTSLATEIPTYQRKNMFVYNKEVINADTIFSGEDVTPFQGPLSYIWNVELKD